MRCLAGDAISQGSYPRLLRRWEEAAPSAQEGLLRGQKSEHQDFHFSISTLPQKHGGVRTSKSLGFHLFFFVFFKLKCSWELGALSTLEQKTSLSPVTREPHQACTQGLQTACKAPLIPKYPLFGDFLTSIVQLSNYYRDSHN